MQECVFVCAKTRYLDRLPHNALWMDSNSVHNIQGYRVDR